MERQADMRTVRRTAFLLIAVLGVSGFAAAAEFSADMIHVLSKNKTKRKIHVKDRKIRVEVPGGGTVTIMDLDAGTMVVLQPAARTFLKVGPLPPMAQWASTDKEARELGATRRLVGTEEIGGGECRKYRIDYDNKAMGSVLQWFSEDIGFPMKTVHRSRSACVTMTLENVSTERVDVSLFEVPSDYKQRASPTVRTPEKK